MSTKFCNSCQTEKLLSEFYPDKTHNDGYHSTCKVCNNAYSKAYRERHREKMDAYKRRLKENNPIKYLLIQAKARCKHLGGIVPFAINPEDVTYVSHCPVLGVELAYASRQSKRGMVVDNAASLDRIIPAYGYVPGNVRIVSWRANRLKNDITLEEMRKVIDDYTRIVESVDNGLRLTNCV